MSLIIGVYQLDRQAASPVNALAGCFRVRCRQLKIGNAVPISSGRNEFRSKTQQGVPKTSTQHQASPPTRSRGYVRPALGSAKRLAVPLRELRHPGSRLSSKSTAN
jgi:hypothetical protein